MILPTEIREDMNCGLKNKYAEYVHKYWICFPGMETIFKNIGGIQMVESIPNCPSCGSSYTCEIVYGYPSDIEEYLKLVSKREICPGGCIHNENSPTWHCNDCQFHWGKYNISNKTNSFDFDQGFNLDGVYDQ